MINTSRKRKGYPASNLPKLHRSGEANYSGRSSINEQGLNSNHPNRHQTVVDVQNAVLMITISNSARSRLSLSGAGNVGRRSGFG